MKRECEKEREIESVHVREREKETWQFIVGFWRTKALRRSSSFLRAALAGDRVAPSSPLVRRRCCERRGWFAGEQKGRGRGERHRPVSR